MFTAFSTALSGLNADTTAVDVIGNNLANLNTTGFKGSDVSFHDLVNQALQGGQTEPGFGVTTPTITQVFSQGSIQPSDQPYAAAIQGNGFFVVNDPNSGQLYTRNGDFTVDSNGNLLTQTGQNVEGWNAPNGGTLNTTGAIGNIVLSSGQLSQPVATANITTQINLDASQTVGSSGASFSTTIPVYDSLGTTHDVTVDFQKTAANTWSYTATVPGADLTSGTAGTPSQIATGSLTFDSNGNLLTPAPPPPAANASIPFPITGLADGASDLNINFNLWNTSGATPVSNITQVDSTSSASAPVQDGNPAAQITGVSISTHGEVIAQYAGGTPRVVAQLALAGITNPESLASLGNGNYTVTAATSLPSIGVPNTGGRGDIVGGSLESSTVDIATQFTNLIVYQRSYEANAKVVTTADTLSQDTINIIPQS